MKDMRVLFYVPWSNFSEWNAVKELMFSSDTKDIIRAYEIILMWKLRFDNLPAYIECTRSLLQVMIKEYEATKNCETLSTFEKHDLQLSYSTALIRFVNLVSSVSSYKGESLYLAAKNQNVPDWIVNMRHDAAHGQDLPALESLYKAAELSLKWLLDNYWANAENAVGENYDVSQPPQELMLDEESEMNARNFFKKVFEVWEFCDVGIENIEDMPQEFFLHVDEMFCLYDFYYVKELGRKICHDVQRTMKINESSKEAHESIKTKQFKKFFVVFLKNLVESKNELAHSLIMSLLDTSFLSEKSFLPKRWKPIIHLIQKLKSFAFLLEALFELAGKEYKAASKWLVLFSPLLLVLSKQWSAFRSLAKHTKNKKRKDLKSKMKKQFSAEESQGGFDLVFFEPPALSVDTVRQVLLEPDILPRKTIVQYLKLVKPRLPKATIQLLKELMSLRESGAKDTEEDEKVYSVEDLENINRQHEIEMVCEAALEGEGWTKSSIDVSAWSGCPLGLLPFQTKVDCSLPEDLAWKRVPSTRKRSTMPLIKHAAEMKRMKQV